MEWPVLLFAVQMAFGHELHSTCMHPCPIWGNMFTCAVLRLLADCPTIFLPVQFLEAAWLNVSSCRALGCLLEASASTAPFQGSHTDGNTLHSRAAKTTTNGKFPSGVLLSSKALCCWAGDSFFYHKRAMKLACSFGALCTAVRKQSWGDAINCSTSNAAAEAFVIAASAPGKDGEGGVKASRRGEGKYR